MTSTRSNQPKEPGLLATEPANTEQDEDLPEEQEEAEEEEEEVEEEECVARPSKAPRLR